MNKNLKKVGGEDERSERERGGGYRERGMETECGGRETRIDRERQNEQQQSLLLPQPQQKKQTKNTPQTNKQTKTESTEQN